MTQQPVDFATFVADHGDGLLRFAWSLTGDRHKAEDLVQSALTRTYARWPAVAHRDPLAYVRRAVVNGRVSLWRRRGDREVLGRVPDRAVPGRPEDDVAERLAVRAALDAVPRRQRAVLILRYLEDLPDEQIARTLGISDATVRSQAHRGLATLRQNLGKAGYAVAPDPPVGYPGSGRMRHGLGRQPSA